MSRTVWHGSSGNSSNSSRGRAARRLPRPTPRHRRIRHRLLPEPRQPPGGSTPRTTRHPFPRIRLVRRGARKPSSPGERSMAVERTPSGSSLIDVLDRVLDKGIVIDAWVRVSLVGIDLVTVEARIVVASIDTYLKYSEAVGITAPVSRPRELGGGDELERMQRENAELRRQLELRNG